MRGRKGTYTFKLWGIPFVTLLGFYDRYEAEEYYRDLIGARFKSNWKSYYSV